MRKRMLAMLLTFSILLPLLVDPRYVAYAEETVPAAVTEAPTDGATETAAEEYTEAPTGEATEGPTGAPTEGPTEEPTGAPTEAPAETPTGAPTEAPTEAPTDAPTEKTTGAPVEEIDASDPDYSENVGKHATFNVAEFGYFDFSNVAGGESLVFTAEEISAELTVVITDWHVDESEGIWYKIEAAPDHTLPEDMAQNPWVLDGYVGDEGWSLIKFDAPEEEETPPGLSQTTEQGVTVGVAGDLPEGTQLSVHDVEIDPAEYGIADASTILAALDIRLLTADGAEYQPCEDKKLVAVTIDAEKLGLSDGDIVRLHHNHEGSITVLDPYVVTDGRIIFWANQFSVYIVDAPKSDTIVSQVDTAKEYTMTLGGNPVVFYSQGLDTPGYTVNPGQAGYNKFYVWSVADTGGVIDYTVYNTNLGYHWVPDGGTYDARVAPWIEVTPKKAGTVKLTIATTVQYWPNVNTGSGAQAGVWIGAETLTIRVVNPATGLYIDNQIADNGCLVPKGLEAYSDVTYEWSRSDGNPVRTEALANQHGGVNVSIDRGGIVLNKDDSAAPPVTYTVVAKRDGKVLDSAEYKVLYGNVILNPGFEYPVGGCDNWTPNWGGGRQQYGYVTNGTPDLFWKTTAPGGLHNLGRDIEFGKQGSPHGAVPAEGKQFVELNAENFGSLYQDILTSPGAMLTWSFRHTSRNNGSNNMYVLMGATEDAQSIISEANINDILTVAKAAEDAEREANPGKYDEENTPIPKNGEGFHFTYKDKSYRIWNSYSTFSASTPEAWRTVSGTYVIPEGQYLTRLFFVSDTENGISTEGNLIDGVFAGEQMTYLVEYYHVGENGVETMLGHEPLTSDGEPQMVAAYVTQTLTRLNDMVTEYKYPYSIEINGKPYPGTVKDLQQGLYIVDYGAVPDDWVTPTFSGYVNSYEDANIVLRIKFRSPNIVVTKTVDIPDWETMTALEKKALIGDGLEYVFTLCDQHGTQILDVSSITTSIIKESPSGGLVAESSFDLKSSHLDHTYLIQENAESIEEIPGYVWCGVKYYDENDQEITSFELKNEDGYRVRVIKAVNTYAPKGNLEIHKEIEVFPYNPQWLDKLKNESFDFTLELEDMDSVDAKLKGPYSYTIKNEDTGVTVETGTLTLESGSNLTFSLKHREYILIENLPKVKYTLTEASAGAGYKEPYYYIGSDGPSEACSSEVPKGDTEVIRCYNPAEISNGDLKISKRVEADNTETEFSRDFWFTVVLRNAAISGVTKEFTVRYEKSKGELTDTGSGYRFKPAGSAEFVDLPVKVTAEEALGEYMFRLRLYDGLTAIIEDLPACGYEVMEDDYSADKFATTWEGKRTGFLGDVNVVGDDPIAEMTCVNIYNMTTGKLDITKTVKKEYERDVVPGTEFVFTVTPAPDSGITLEDGEYSVSVGETSATATCADNKIEVRISFTDEEMAELQGRLDTESKKLTIEGLPFGSYVVTEAENPDYQQSSRTQNATVGGTAGKADFVNTYRQHLGEITIKKYVTGTTAKDPVPVKITGTGVDMVIPVVPDSPVTVYDLPLGTYTVTELISWNWRYTATAPTTQSVELKLVDADGKNAANAEVVFRNTYQEDKWLSSTDVEPNTFT